MAKKHTSLYIDEALLAEAQQALGTRGKTETVHAALTEAVGLMRRRGLFTMPFSLTEDDLRQMRDETGPYAEGA